MRFMGILGGIALCTACADNTARHIPANPLLLPVHGATAAIENASYNAKRRKVEDHVRRHHAEILQEIKKQPGPHIQKAFALANVPDVVQKDFLARLKAEIDQYTSSQEALVVALMVHGN